MKKLVVMFVSLFAITASAEWNTTAYTTNVSSQQEAQEIIKKINSGRIYIPGCGGQQEVYAYSFSNNAGSYVKSADGTFRPVRAKATFKVRCQD